MSHFGLFQVSLVTYSRFLLNLTLQLIIIGRFRHLDELKIILEIAS
jgi:hypothetical protein